MLHHSDCLCNFEENSHTMQVAVKKTIQIAVTILLWALFSTTGLAEQRGEQLQMITPGTKMSLLTASPGSDLYAVFGHSALWVYDPTNGIDEVYNWGTFDFDTPNFYLLFMRGRLEYMLTVTPLHHFLRSYRNKDRSVDEQVLNLTLEEKIGIYDFLLENRRPENIHYLYDFFYDNCATRIRDLVDAELEIDWGADPHPHQERSLRDMLKPYVSHIPWIGFGIDILLGVPADKTATPWEYMFLPDEMAIAFQHARHNDGRLLVIAQNELLPLNHEYGRPFPATPVWFFWVLLLLGVGSLLKPGLIRYIELPFFILLGVTGLLLFFLWFFSDHHSMSKNLNLLWALPTHLYFIFRADGSRWPKIYFRFVFYAGLMMMILWPLIPQGFHPAFFPVIGLMTLLAFRRAYKLI